MKRFYVVKHSWTVVHEAESWNEDPEEDGVGSFHFVENSCSANRIEELHSLINKPENQGFCMVCCGEESKFLGRYDSLKAAQAAHRGAIDLNYTEPGTV